MKLTWVKAPPVPMPRGHGGFEEALALLAKRPGKWAVLREYAHAQSAQPTASRLRLRYPDYEFVARASADGKSRGFLYGRKKP